MVEEGEVEQGRQWIRLLTGRIEYAARGGEEQLYAGSDNIDEVAGGFVYKDDKWVDSGEGNSRGEAIQ